MLLYKTIVISEMQEFIGEHGFFIFPLGLMTAAFKLSIRIFLGTPPNCLKIIFKPYRKLS